MNKNERLAYMKKRFPILQEEMADAVIPSGKLDVEDELRMMDSVREHSKDVLTEQELTSDHQ